MQGDGLVEKLNYLFITSPARWLDVTTITCFKKITRFKIPHDNWVQNLIIKYNPIAIAKTIAG